MKWFVIALAMFASAMVISAPASADRKGAPSAQAKAAAKAQVKAAKQQRAVAKARLKQDLANAKAGLKAPKADLKASKAALKRALREEVRLEKVSTKAHKAYAAAAAVRPVTAQVLTDREAALTASMAAWDTWQAARKASEDRRGDLQKAKQQMFDAKANVGYKKYLIHTLPPVGKPVFNQNGVLQLKAVDYFAYAAAPSLKKIVVSPAPDSGSVPPPEPPGPSLPPGVTPPPPGVTKPVAPPEPAGPKLPVGVLPPPSGATNPKPPAEPALSRAQLTVARAESPYQIIPMSVFKQNAADPASAN